VFHLAQILSVVFIGLALAPAIAHAFEYPGKKRLGKEGYIAVQGIYYPGFTLLGMSEPAGLIAVVVLLLFTPAETAPFWLTLIALIGLLGMQVVYWAYTHPTNKFWLQMAGAAPGNLGSGFFAFDPARQRTTWMSEDWRRLRDRWEYSHIARAGLAFVSFFSLIIAIVI
jgi:hypothetical protein